MKKKVPVVSVAEVETANVAGLPMEVTVALADVAGATVTSIGSPATLAVSTSATLTTGTLDRKSVV